MNKRKIINDPVYGFITIPAGIIFDLIDHPWFQRLRRIRQMGLADYVYPGALHTRFHHALGAMHLMGQALQTLQSKGHPISDQESEAAQIAILLHDIGHGPFSHVLEPVLLAGVHHEQMSMLLMSELNRQFDGGLTMAIQMFDGSYPRQFFHQLISSQLDMDRMDYLNRDCFYSGVAEGTIGADRLIKMLDVCDNELVVEEKGLLSIENFLNARRLMYWQVYLHKTSLCAEAMLLQIIRRARELTLQGETLFATPYLARFLQNSYTSDDFLNSSDLLSTFTKLDDYDVWVSIKVWAMNADPVLSSLSEHLLERKLFKIQFMDAPATPGILDTIGKELSSHGIPPELHSYYMVEGQTKNIAYLPENEQIKAKMKDGRVLDISEISDVPFIQALSKIVHKYYICWGKNVSLRP